MSTSFSDDERDNLDLFLFSLAEPEQDAALACVTLDTNLTF